MHLNEILLPKHFYEMTKVVLFFINYNDDCWYTFSLDPLA